MFRECDVFLLLRCVSFHFLFWCHSGFRNIRSGCRSYDSSPHLVMLSVDSLYLWVKPCVRLSVGAQDKIGNVGLWFEHGMAFLLGDGCCPLKDWSLP